MSQCRKLTFQVYMWSQSIHVKIKYSRTYTESMLCYVLIAAVISLHIILPHQEFITQEWWSLDWEYTWEKLLYLAGLMTLFF